MSSSKDSPNSRENRLFSISPSSSVIYTSPNNSTPYSSAAPSHYTTRNDLSYIDGCDSKFAPNQHRTLYSGSSISKTTPDISANEQNFAAYYDSSDCEEVRKSRKNRNLCLCPILPSVSVQITMKFDEKIKRFNTMTEDVDNHITDKYEVRKRLGKGAYGIVWKAIDRRTKEVVALKKIFDAFRNQTDAQRTYREIMFLQEFGRHPNIVKLYNILKADNDRDIYLVFEHMDTDLHNVIKKGGILKDIHKQYIMCQLCRAVKYLHSGNVLHRDLKPSNVLLDADCRVKLADFGLARSLASTVDECDSTPELTEYVATRWYRAPEILLAAKRYTKGVDMWSLGCIIAEMLIGKALFPGTSTINQIERIMNTVSSPCKADIESIGSKYASSVLQKMSSRPLRPIDQLLAQPPAHSVDLMNKLIVFNPYKRITVEECIVHPYVIQFHNPADEPALSYDVTLGLVDHIQLSIDEYRQKLYELIVSKKTHIRRIQHDHPSRFKSRSVVDMHNMQNNGNGNGNYGNENRYAQDDITNGASQRSALKPSKSAPMAEAECSDTGDDTQRARRRQLIHSQNGSQATLTNDHPSSSSLANQHAAMNGSRNNMTCVIDVMSSDHKAYDSYKPMAVQPNQQSRSSSVDSRAYQQQRVVSQSYADVGYQQRALPAQTLASTQYRVTASANGGGQIHNGMATNQQQPVAQQSHKFWNPKTSKLFRSISRGREKKHSSDNSASISSGKSNPYDAQSRRRSSGTALAPQFMTSQKHGTITASGLQALHQYGVNSQKQYGSEVYGQNNGVINQR